MASADGALVVISLCCDHSCGLADHDLGYDLGCGCGCGCCDGEEVGSGDLSAEESVGQAGLASSRDLEGRHAAGHGRWGSGAGRC